MERTAAARQQCGVNPWIEALTCRWSDFGRCRRAMYNTYLLWRHHCSPPHASLIGGSMCSTRTPLGQSIVGGCTPFSMYPCVCSLAQLLQKKGHRHSARGRPDPRGEIFSPVRGIQNGFVHILYLRPCSTRRAGLIQTTRVEAVWLPRGSKKCNNPFAGSIDSRDKACGI